MLQEQHNSKTSEPGYRVGSVWTDLFAKLSGLKYQGKQILLTGLVCAVLGIGYSFLKKPVYLARVNFVIEENKQELESISSDDIDIEVMSTEEDNEHCVYVKFSNFADEESAEEYAEFLAETLPLLLFETTRMQ